jgi:hypothetical protein
MVVMDVGLILRSIVVFSSPTGPAQTVSAIDEGSGGQEMLLQCPCPCVDWFAAWAEVFGENDMSLFSVGSLVSEPYAL